MKRLPTSVTVAGQLVSVEQVPGLYDLGDKHGDWCSRTNTIRLQPVSKHHPSDTVYAAFYHELLHAVLDLSGHSEWSKDEEAVERLAQLLYQAEKTRTYD